MLYCINQNQDSYGNNEVHTIDCKHLPEYYNREDLGWHFGGKEAVAYAKAIGWKNADGCYYCCREAHNG